MKSRNDNSQAISPNFHGGMRRDPRHYSIGLKIVLNVNSGFDINGPVHPNVADVKMVEVPDNGF